ncbi:MAG: TlpA family protein disulfide reductase [Desulfovibrionaceae bacterium]|nr:TlpA family protein disulfide reductase [Desulfovibrionaceae bacterium]
MRTKKFLLSMAVVLFFWGSLLWATRGEGPSLLSSSPEKSPVEFAGKIISLGPKDLSNLVLRQGAGKVTVITVFASWCPPCREEIPLLVGLRKDLPEEDVFIAGISADEDLGLLKRFLEKHAVNFPVYSGSSGLFRSMGVDAIPHLFVFDRGGTLIESIVGLPSEAILRNLLNEAGSSGE